jgi:hypothetical protein
MINKYPLAVLLVSLAGLSLSAWIGATGFASLREQVARHKDEFNVIQGATLTLLALIIGFTFSMALGRYDQRKNYEEEEANAIGTEFLRAELLPAAEAAKVKSLLRQYLDQRVLYYTTRDNEKLAKVVDATTKLQNEMWATVKAPALANPNALTGIAVAGMNDVINSQGYTQAAWANRIPVAAWTLLGIIAVATTMLVGIGMRREAGFSRLLIILPAVIAIAFFFIADIDSPRRGVIRVTPQNLQSLAESLRAT